MDWIYNLSIGILIGGLLFWVLGKIWRFFEGMPRVAEGLSIFFGWLSWIFGYFKRDELKYKIEATINGFINKTGRKIFRKNIFYYGFKLEWVRVKRGKKTYIEEGDVVIKLDHDVDNRRNLLAALSVYLDESFLTKFKLVSERYVWYAGKLNVMAEVARGEGEDYFNYYADNFLVPSFKADKRLENIYDRMYLLNEKGTFYGVLVPEFAGKGDLFYGRGKPYRLNDEIFNFVNFAYDIADKEAFKREHGHEPNLAFISQYFKVGIVLVARAEVEGFESHYKAAVINFKKGATHVYVTGWGERNLEGVESVVSALKDSGEYEITDKPYIFKKRRVYINNETGEREVEKKDGVCYGFKKMRKLKN